MQYQWLVDMRLITFWQDGRLHAGVGEGEEVRDAGPISDIEPTDGAWRGIRAGRGPVLQRSDLRLGPCLLTRGKLICIGLNYRRHAEESNAAIPETPVAFSKFDNSLAGPHDDVPLPHVAQKYDYEAELGLVVGRRCRDAAERDALDYVFGYCSANDISARDLQFRTSQWLLGKSLDRFLPVGPELVTSDEVGDPQSLAIRCWVNGQLRQNSTTADMIFSVAEIVSYLSRHMTLEPGDFIATGTPEGVIFGLAEQQWLAPGDLVEVEVEGLGRLRNRLVSATQSQ